MTSMLERAAAAVELHIESHCPSCQVQLPGDPVDIARAVLQAIREPDEAMVEAAVHADIPGGRYADDTFTESIIFEDDAPVIWQAMIDAALAE